MTDTNAYKIKKYDLITKADVSQFKLAMNILWQKFIPHGNGNS